MAFVLMGCAFLLTLGFDLLLAMLMLAPARNIGGDGLGPLLPLLLAMVLVPVQGFYVLASGCAGVRWLVGPRIDVGVGRFVGLACSVGVMGALLGPAALNFVLVMMLWFAPDSMHALISDDVDAAIGSAMLVAAVLWVLGALGTGVAFGLFDRYLPILLIPLWPVTALLFMFS